MSKESRIRELLEERQRLMQGTQQPASINATDKSGRVQELLAERDNLMRAQEVNKVSTIGEDLSNLWQGAKELPGRAWEGAKNIFQGVQQHPGQASAGIIPAVSSVVDIPALGFNLLNAPADYLFEKVTQKKLPEEHKDGIPYYGHEAGTAVANALVGDPKTESEQYARLGGELGSSVLNPTKALSGISKVGSKIARGAAGFSPEKYEAFAKAGITPKLSEVSEFGVLENVEKGLEQVPWSSGKFKKVATVREDELNNLFQNIGEINQAKSLSKTGELTKRGGKEYNKKAMDVSKQLYDRAWKGIDDSAPVPMANTYESIRASLHAVSDTAKARIAKSATGKELLELADDIIENRGAIPFYDVKNIYKKDIDMGVKQWEGVAEKDQAVLKKISSALKEDMDDFTIAQNPQAARNLKKADAHYHKYSERNRGIANKAANETDPTKTFNNAISDLKGGDIVPARVITQRLPAADKRVFSATVMNELGRNPAGEFDPVKWAKELNKLRPEASDVALSGYPKAQANQIRHMAKALMLTKGSKETAGVNYLINGLGLIYSPVGVGKVIGGSRIATEIFTNPSVTKAMYDASKAKTPEALEKVLARHSILPRIEITREENESEGTGPYKQKDLQGFIKDSPALKVIMKIEEEPNELAAYKAILQDLPATM